MKKIYITSIFILLFAFSAQAQTDTASSTRPKSPMPYQQIKQNFEATKDTRANVLTQKREVMMTAKKEVFASRKTALVERLKLTLSNLEKGKTSLLAFITKLETEGKNIGNSRELLKTAEEKIAVLKTDIAALVAYVPTVSSATSSEVSLEKPRLAGQKAIKSANEARQALHAVIVELRKNK